ncbi:MAG: hypothetical protein SFV15_23495 [Polyangiaceae bacterium]|nr:hypothetical protein [Polyangiaceae bacterium]
MKKVKLLTVLCVIGLTSFGVTRARADIASVITPISVSVRWNRSDPAAGGNSVNYVGVSFSSEITFCGERVRKIEFDSRQKSYAHWLGMVRSAMSIGKTLTVIDGTTQQGTCGLRTLIIDAL